LHERRTTSAGAVRQLPCYGQTALRIDTVAADGAQFLKSALNVAHVRSHTELGPAIHKAAGYEFNASPRAVEIAKIGEQTSANFRVQLRYPYGKGQEATAGGDLFHLIAPDRVQCGQHC
jgi:hypothetical protein